MRLKRVLSLTFCALLALSLFPVPAYAAIFNEAATGTGLAQWLLAPNADVTITGTPVYTGVLSACSWFNAIDLGTIGEDHFALPAGILLTSGDGTPAESNTIGSYGVDTTAGGDADIKTYADLTFTTYDASVLEFTFTVPEGIPAVEFLFMFGSDEYAEYKDSDYVDGAIVLVDGVNYAQFSNGKPLKVISDAEMVTNQGLSIEYDGISAPKRIVGLLDQSLSIHTIKIAIADTSDGTYDSGLFLSAMKVSHETSGGISEAKSTDATITSGSYTIAQSGDIGSISEVPANTAKDSFCANLVKGNAAQTWNTDGLQDPVQEGDTLVVTAEDGTTTLTYTVHLAYAVTIGAADHGTAGADKSLASPGDTVTLTPTPEDGYHLKEWQASPPLSIVNNQFSMPGEAVTITPVFEQDSNVATVTSGIYTVTESGVSGEISRVPDGTTAAAFLANIVKGHLAQTWNTDALHSPVQEGDTLAVTAQDGTTTLTYTVRLAYAVTVGAADHGTANADTTLAAPGDTISLTAAPDSGFRFKEWQSTPALSIVNNQFVMPAGAVSVVPIFEKNSDNATVTSAIYTVLESGGVETISYVPDGTELSVFLANLTKGDDAQTWNTDSLHDPVQDGDTLVVTAQDGTTILTYTVHLAYAVSAGPADHGSSSADKSLAAPGDTVALTATSDSGYHFKEWQISPAMSVVNDQFTMPAEAVTVTPVFEQDSTIAAVVSPVYMIFETGGAGEISGIPEGTSAADFLANIEKEHAAQTWNTDSLHDPVLEGDTLIVTAEDGITTLTYTVHLAFAVTVGAAEYGTANADKSLALLGETVTLTATPESGYHLKEWVTSPSISVSGGQFIMPAQAVTVTPIFEANDAAIRAVEAKIDALPDPVAAGDQDILDAQDDILDAKKDYDALSSDDRPGVDPDRVTKLDKLITRLTALLVIVPESNGVSAEGIGASVLVPELDDPDTGRVVVELAAEHVGNNNALPNFAIAEEALTDGGQKIVSGFDLSLIKTVFDGVGAQLSRETVPASGISGSITVLLPVPAGYGDGTGLTVVYIDDDGNVTTLPTTTVMVGGAAYLQFTTTHFSLYGIVANITKNTSLSSGYPMRTLTDQKSGFSVTGIISAEASLRVNALSAESGGIIGDAIRQHAQSMTDTLFMAGNVSLTHDSSGGFSLALPVGSQYDGQRVTLLQYVGGKLKTMTAVVQNGTGSFHVSGLGSIALFVPVQAIDPMTIPKTGSAPQPFAMILIGLALAGAAWMRRKKPIK